MELDKLNASPWTVWGGCGLGVTMVLYFMQITGILETHPVLNEFWKSEINEI